MNSTKISRFFSILMWGLFLLGFLKSNGQYGKAEPKPKQFQKLEVINADSTNIITNATSAYREMIGNVALKHKNVILKANYAKQDVIGNTVTANGKIRIIQGDTLTITGDRLDYNANTRFAIVEGNTVLKDKNTVLKTEKLTYDMRTGQVTYPQHGTIKDEKTVLDSESGRYSTKTKVFNFIEKVVVVGTDFDITTDSLNYDSNSKVAYFLTQTNIKNKGDLVVVQGGSYNTETKKSDFKGRTWYDTPDYLIMADTLDFDGVSESGIAKGNVEMVKKAKADQDKVIIKGDIGIRDKAKGLVKVYGHAKLNNLGKKDTLHMFADTLVSFENQIDTLDKKLIAMGKVVFYNKEMVGTADSLTYDQRDSIIYFNKAPILWNSENQLVADSITIFNKSTSTKLIKLVSNAFVISTDSLTNHNQVKGRKIDCIFDQDNELKKVNVDGNGESNYYAVDALKVVGMNHVQCGRMSLVFKKNQVTRINFVGDPDAQFYPPKYITAKVSKLTGFDLKTKPKQYLDENKLANTSSNVKPGGSSPKN